MNSSASIHSNVLVEIFNKTKKYFTRYNITYVFTPQTVVVH